MLPQTCQDKVQGWWAKHIQDTSQIQKVISYDHPGWWRCL